jgi:hypothetical protein
MRRGYFESGLPRCAMSGRRGLSRLGENAHTGHDSTRRVENLGVDESEKGFSILVRLKLMQDAFFSRGGDLVDRTFLRTAVGGRAVQRAANVNQEREA